MNTHPDLDSIIRRTRRYEFEDGLREMQMALLLLLSSFAVWLAFSPLWLGFIAALMQLFGRWAVWFNLLPVLFVPLAVWGSLRLMARLRQAWLWRDSGTVIPVRWQVPRRVTLVASLIIVGSIAFGLGLRSLGRVGDAFVLHMLWAATGWAFGYTLFGVGREIGLARYVWLGAVGGLASSLVLFLPLEFGDAALALGLMWAALLTIGGGIGLHRASQILRARR